MKGNILKTKKSYLLELGFTDAEIKHLLYRMNIYVYNSNSPLPPICPMCVVLCDIEDDYTTYLKEFLEQSYNDDTICERLTEPYEIVEEVDLTVYFLNNEMMGTYLNYMDRDKVNEYVSKWYADNIVSGEDLIVNKFYQLDDSIVLYLGNNKALYLGKFNVEYTYNKYLLIETIMKRVKEKYVWENLYLVGVKELRNLQDVYALDKKIYINSSDMDFNGLDTTFIRIVGD